jgi:uncharacterized damage-inducible protein DinB
MTTKEFILEQLSATRNTKNWFVSLNDAVKGLTAAQAKWYDVNVNHSVWQIVNHLTFWNERWLIRTSGEVPPKMEGENSGTFSGDLGDEAEWQSAVKKLDDTLGEFETRLKDMDDEALRKEAFEGYEGSWYDMFAQMTIHTAYHIGQIVYIRKQQGSWDSAQGVE